MLRCVFALLVAVAAIAAPVAAAIAAPAAAPPVTQFDGRWSVVIETDRGTCDRAYRYGIEIRNGTVSYVGENAFDIRGQVARNGKVHVRVSRAGSYADGHGWLSSDGGSGVWRGVGSGVCSGTWTAERR
jgi:hypothetical protein